MVHSNNIPALTMMESLGAKHDSYGEEDEEQRHFKQVCNSYQQYATFHQVREQGINHRKEQLLSSAASSRVVSTAAGQQCCNVEEVEGPTVESILKKTTSPQQQKKTNEILCQATIRNQFFLDNVLQHCGAMTSQEVLRQRKNDSIANGPSANKMEWSTEDQISKIDSVLKSIARDWSIEGRQERSVVYDKLLSALERYLPIIKLEDTESGMDGSLENNATKCSNRGPPRVAVPGSGLGRLAWEIYSKGYSAQGSDFSLPMLLASDFILNGCGRGPTNISHRQFAISPWLAETKNVKSLQDRVRTVVVPDVDPTSVMLNSNDGDDAPEFSMLAGEFQSLYSHFLPAGQSRHGEANSNKKFNAVVCSFFIDTAPTLPHYLITIWHMLEVGGLFINMGPLMYHWSGHGGLTPDDLDDAAAIRSDEGDHMSAKHKQRTHYLDQRYLQSVDYTWEEINSMIVSCGFEIIEEETDVTTRYTSDMSSMMKTTYDCVYFVARKTATA